jgi:tetratricopeptide (TPR) repeat protein
MADIKSEKEQLMALEDLFRQQRFSNALGIAKKASSDFPNSYPIKFLHARTLKELNKLAEAEEVLKELMLVYPNNIKLLLESGKVALLRNKFDESKEYYNKILFLDPFNTEAKNSIEKINVIKKAGLVRKGKGDFVSYQDKKLQTADTLPEFDSRKLLDILGEEPPPPPPPPPPAPAMEEEIPVMSETPAPGLFQENTQEPGMEVTEIPAPISDREEMNSSPGREVEIPEIPPIPAFEIPPLPDLEKEPEEMERAMAMENQEPKEKLEAAGEPWQEDPAIEETGFVTESAAQLYLKQGLLDDALVIYKKLYNSRKEEKFLSRIKQLKRVMVNQKKIRVLNELLEHIQQKGVKIV